MRATVVGDPSIAAGMSLTLTGTQHFDQSFEMDNGPPRVRHAGPSDTHHGAICEARSQRHLKCTE